MWPMFLLTRCGGILLRSVLLSILAALLIASDGVNVGVVMNLCLKVMLLDPQISLVLWKFPHL